MDNSLIENKLLKKHADLILCSNPMSLIQRKIFNVLLYKALPSMKSAVWFEMPLRELCDSIGYTSRNYVPLVNAIETITQLAIRWRIIDSKTKLDDVISDTIAVITRVKIEKGICYYKYNDDIKMKLLRPGMYGKIDLNVQSAISSSFGLVLYELSEKFKNIACTPWFTVEQLRELMGVQKNAYKSFYDFEKNVVKKAITEVNSKSKFDIVVLKKKKGKVVDQLKFLINPKEIIISQIEKNEGSNLEEIEIIKILTTEFKVNIKQALKLFKEYSNVSKYGENYLEEKIKVVKKSNAYNLGNLSNPAGFIVEALKNDYKNAPSVASLIHEKERLKQNNEFNSRQKRSKEEEHQREYTQYLNKIVSEHLSYMSEEDFNNLKAEFVDHCQLNNKSAIINYFNNGEGLDRPMVKTVFNAYVIKRDFEGRVMTKEQFVKTG